MIALLDVFCQVHTTYVQKVNMSMPICVDNYIIITVYLAKKVSKILLQALAKEGGGVGGHGPRIL